MFWFIPLPFDHHSIKLSKLYATLPLFRFSEFYDEDKNLLDYNCPKKEDFIKKGIGK